jgi:maleylacetate reductase
MPDPASLRFSYDTRPMRVVFGAGSVRALPDELDALGARRIVLITTPARPAQRAALTMAIGGRLADSIADAGAPATPEQIAKAAAVVQAAKADACVAVGGGSVIGLAKAIALRSTHITIAVPTTYSGSEMTTIFGVTEGGEKRTGRDPRVAPRLVIYDPELTYGLAPATSAASGMNAIAHCVEAAYAPGASPVALLMAWDGLRRLADSLPEIMSAPGDPRARADALAGAHLAGRALDMTSMGLHHKLCHVLVGSFGLPHAQTHAALLPCVTAFNAPAAPEAMTRVAAALRADDAVQGLVDLTRHLGTPKLKDLGFGVEQIPRAAALTVKDSYPNPRPVTESDVRRILEDALAQ